MGYLHIDNLYKAQEILAFRHCYALEKIHGTSAHVSWKDGLVNYFSGGESHDRFVELFDGLDLYGKFTAGWAPCFHITVFGEAYGGKQQGMSKTYGPTLKFIAFDVKVDDKWLAVPQAAELVEYLGLEFVYYTLISTDMALIDLERDRPSIQAMRNGIVEPKLREGVVLRPPFEVKLNNGNRVIAKHKRAEFAERATKVELDPTKRDLMTNADAIANEWVTPMRLEHVIDTIISNRDSKTMDMSDTQSVIVAMVEDITREAAGEIVDSSHVRKAISRRAVQLFKQFLQG